MAELNGEDLRRGLLSADCLSDSAIFFGSAQVNTPSSRSSALLSLVTRPDQRVSDDDFDFVGIHCTPSEANAAHERRQAMTLSHRPTARFQPSASMRLAFMIQIHFLKCRIVGLSIAVFQCGVRHG